MPSTWGLSPIDLLDLLDETLRKERGAGEATTQVELETALQGSAVMLRLYAHVLELLGLEPPTIVRESATEEYDPEGPYVVGLQQADPEDNPVKVGKGENPREAAEAAFALLRVYNLLDGGCPDCQDLDQKTGEYR